jgi:hypothetical protein
VRNKNVQVAEILTKRKEKLSPIWTKNNKFEIAKFSRENCRESENEACAIF